MIAILSAVSIALTLVVLCRDDLFGNGNIVAACYSVTRMIAAGGPISIVVAFLLISTSKTWKLIYEEDCNPGNYSRPNFCTLVGACGVQIRSILIVDDFIMNNISSLSTAFGGLLLVGIIISIYIYVSKLPDETIRHRVMFTANRLTKLLAIWNFDVQYRDEEMECPICLRHMLFKRADAFSSAHGFAPSARLSSGHGFSGHGLNSRGPSAHGYIEGGAKSYSVRSGKSMLSASRMNATAGPADSYRSGSSTESFVIPMYRDKSTASMVVSGAPLIPSPDQKFVVSSSSGRRWSLLATDMAGGAQEIESSVSNRSRPPSRQHKRGGTEVLESPTSSADRIPRLNMRNFMSSRMSAFNKGSKFTNKQIVPLEQPFEEDKHPSTFAALRNNNNNNESKLGINHPLPPTTLPSTLELSLAKQMNNGTALRSHNFPYLSRKQSDDEKEKLSHYHNNNIPLQPDSVSIKVGDVVLGDSATIAEAKYGVGEGSTETGSQRTEALVEQTQPLPSDGSTAPRHPAAEQKLQRCESVQPGDYILAQVPCGHIFHKACIMEWGMRENSCPVCRADLGGDDHELQLIAEGEESNEMNH